MIYGAVDYAKTLGFDPHPDFERAKKNLGTPMENLAHHEFGKDVKPYYFCGPYDNSEKIMAQLRTSVGDGNFDYTVAIDSGFDALI